MQNMTFTGSASHRQITVRVPSDLSDLSDPAKNFSVIWSVSRDTANKVEAADVHSLQSDDGFLLYTEQYGDDYRLLLVRSEIREG